MVGRLVSVLFALRTGYCSQLHKSPEQYTGDVGCRRVILHVAACASPAPQLESVYLPFPGLSEQSHHGVYLLWMLNRNVHCPSICKLKRKFISMYDDFGVETYRNQPAKAFS